MVGLIKEVFIFIIMARNPFRSVIKRQENQKAKSLEQRIWKEADTFHANCASSKDGKWYKEVRFSEKFKDMPIFCIDFEECYFRSSSKVGLYYKQVVPVIHCKKDWFYPRNRPTDEDLAVLHNKELVDVVIRYGLNIHTGDYSDIGKITVFILSDGIEYNLHGEKLGSSFNEEEVYKSRRDFEFFGLKKREDGLYEEDWDCYEPYDGLDPEWIDELGDCIENDNWDSDPF